MQACADRWNLPVVERPPGPHRLAFGAFLGVMALGLLIAGAWLYASVYAVLLGVMLALVHRGTRDELFFLIAMNIAFPLMRGAVPVIRARRYDDLLLSIDHRLTGTYVSVWAERFVTFAVTELMSVCYILFFPLLCFSLLRYFLRHKERLGRFYSGLFTIYGVGFLGYLLVPAAGPYLAFPELFTVPIVGGPVTHLNQMLVTAGSNRVDVFPSLHCAVSGYILGFSFRYQRREFWLLLLPICGLWLATIYLRYHYLVDVLFGLALSGVGLAIAMRRIPSVQGRLACN